MEYVLSFISSGWDVQFLKGEGGIYYGGHHFDPAKHEVIVPFESSPNIVQEIKLDDENKLNTDLFAVIFKLLVDEVNQHDLHSRLDAHGRVSFSKSFQKEAGIESCAIVDRYVNKLLSYFTPEPIRKNWLPSKKSFAIGLTHDVDNPMKYAILKAPLLYSGASNKDLRYILKKKLKAVARVMQDPSSENYWVFDKVMDEESKHGFKSTSYFAVTPYYGEGGARRDVPYDIEHAKFSGVFKSMKERGFEIGLHAGYSAFQSLDRFKNEKQKLERLAGVEIKGLRHHYWHLGSNPEQTLKRHFESGFLYDSSIGFNDHMGFRRSVATPYFPWCHEDEAPVHTLQLPVFCMDGNLFKRTKDVDVALAEFEKYLDEVERVGGVGMIDWHTRTSYPANKQYHNWGVGYVKILELLATRKNAWVTSAVEIAEAFLRSQNTK